MEDDQPVTFLIGRSLALSFFPLTRCPSFLNLLRQCTRVTNSRANHSLQNGDADRQPMAALKKTRVSEQILANRRYNGSRQGTQYSKFLSRTNAEVAADTKRNLIPCRKFARVQHYRSFRPYPDLSSIRINPAKR